MRAKCVFTSPMRMLQVLLRLRETRLCVEFAGGGRGAVVRECRVSEGTFEELHAAGAPPAEVGRCVGC